MSISFSKDKSSNPGTARALIKSTYKLRDELAICRSPLIRHYEFPDAYNFNGSNTPEDEAKAYNHIYKNRWKLVREPLQDFEAQTLEAEALWGQDIKNKAERLRKCAKELTTAIEAFISDKASGGQDFQSDRNYALEIRRKVSNTNEDKNPLAQEILSSVNEIEDFLRPKLKKK